MEYFVYEISCSLDERVYIGMSKSPGNRFKGHLAASKNENFPLCRAIREYGKESFSWRPLTKHSTRTEAAKAERMTVEAYRRGGRKLFNGNLILDEDRKCAPDKREKHITIRPRVNSALERIHEERRKEFPDLAHKWAEMEEQGWAESFKDMARKSEEGE